MSQPYYPCSKQQFSSVSLAFKLRQREINKSQFLPGIGAKSVKIGEGNDLSIKLAGNSGRMILDF